MLQLASTVLKTRLIKEQEKRMVTESLVRLELDYGQTGDIINK